MKDLLFFCTLLNFLTILTAQTYKLDEAIYSYWSENDWVYSSKYNYEYDENANTSYLYYKEWTDGSWRDNMRYEYLYDDENRMSLINILQYAEEVWKEYMKIEYTYSLENNDYETVTFILHGTVWDNYTKTNYALDEECKLTGSVTSMWTEGEWFNYSKTEYQYTPEGETDEYIIYIWENETWENYHRSDCIYDSDNLNYLNYKYMWNAGWQLSSKDDNSFDANGNMIRSITQNYAEGNWTNQSRSENSYTEFTGLIQPLSPLPEEIELYQNYPNPFNPETEISFSLKNETFITLELFNTSGQLIKVLYEGKHSSGDHKIKIDASDLESGTYFYKLENEVNSVIRKMTVIK